MAVDPRTPIRRSPLDRAHAALGASFVSDTVRWPTTYGDGDAERAAVAERAGIAEIGPLDQLTVRGSPTGDALGSIGARAAPRTVMHVDGGVYVWQLGDDEAFVLSRPGGRTIGDLAAAVRAAGAAATDLSSGMTALRLVGPAAPAILAEVCAVDVSPDALDEGDIVQAPMASVRVSLTRRDHDGIPGYGLLVARDQAEYLWDSLLTVGAAHGLAPVGADAIGWPR